MAQFNANDPQYQRAIQRAAAKAGMRGNQANTAPIAAQHAKYQLGRQTTFGGLALQQAAQRQAFNQALVRNKQWGQEQGLREAYFGENKSRFYDQMDERKSNLDWTMGLGLATAGLSYLEGKRRQGIMATENAYRAKHEKWLDSQLGKKQLAASERNYTTDAAKYARKAGYKG
jgi:hypothetical protein